MTNRTMSRVRADRDEIDCLVAALMPLAGGIWLVTDLVTLVHWTVTASSVTPVTDAPDGRFCRAFGLITIRDQDEEPIFLINERDEIEWIEPNQILAVRELGDVACEMRFERLDDLGARVIEAANMGCNRSAGAPLRTIALGSGQFLQIYDDQLPTGDANVDVLLRTIEETIDARRRLFGPSAGTLDVMDQLDRDLNGILRATPVRSHIWAAVLREQIACLRQALAA